MKKIQAVALPILAVLMLSMSACTAPQPVNPTPTVSPSSTNTPAPVPSAAPPTSSTTPEAPEPVAESASVVIQADSLLVRNNGEAQEYTYAGANASEAIEAVTAAYGFAGEEDYSGDQKCWYQMTTFSWPGLDIAFPGQDADASQSFLVHAPEVSEGVEVSTLHGAHVGDLWEPYLAELNPAPELIWSGGYEGVEYARTLDDPTTLSAYHVEGQPTTSGATVLAENGVISYLSAPDDVYGDC